MKQKIYISSKNIEIDELYYKHRKSFIAFARSSFSNISVEDIEEIYNDSFMVLIEKLQNDNNFKLTCSVQTYINQVGKNKICDKYKKRCIETNPIDENLMSNLKSICSDINNDEDTDCEIILNCIEDQPSPCKDILISYYWDNLSMKEIANIYNYNSPDVAKQQKSRCFAKIKEVIKEALKNKRK